MTLPEWLSRMDAHLIQQDAYLARLETEQRAQIEMLRQSNAALAEAAQLLKATRLDIEARWRQRRQERLWSTDTAFGGPFMGDRLFDAPPDDERDF